MITEQGPQVDHSDIQELNSPLELQSQFDQEPTLNDLLPHVAEQFLRSTANIGPLLAEPTATEPNRFITADIQGSPNEVRFLPQMVFDGDPEAVEEINKLNRKIEIVQDRLDANRSNAINAERIADLHNQRREIMVSHLMVPQPEKPDYSKTPKENYDGPDTPLKPRSKLVYATAVAATGATALIPGIVEVREEYSKSQEDINIPTLAEHYASRGQSYDTSTTNEAPQSILNLGEQPSDEDSDVLNTGPLQGPAPSGSQTLSWGPGATSGGTVNYAENPGSGVGAEAVTPQEITNFYNKLESLYRQRGLPANFTTARNPNGTLVNAADWWIGPETNPINGTVVRRNNLVIFTSDAASAQGMVNPAINEVTVPPGSIFAPVDGVSAKLGPAILAALANPNTNPNNWVTNWKTAVSNNSKFRVGNNNDHDMRTLLFVNVMTQDQLRSLGYKNSFGRSPAILAGYNLNPQGIREIHVNVAAPIYNGKPNDYGASLPEIGATSLFGIPFYDDFNEMDPKARSGYGLGGFYTDKQGYKVPFSSIRGIPLDK